MTGAMIANSVAAKPSQAAPKHATRRNAERQSRPPRDFSEGLIFERPAGGKKPHIACHVGEISAEKRCEERPLVKNPHQHDGALAHDLAGAARLPGIQSRIEDAWAAERRRIAGPAEVREGTHIDEKLR